MINRRSFLKATGLIGSTLFLAGKAVYRSAYAQSQDQEPHFAVATGPDYYDNTHRAIEALGGMKRFVSPGDKVGILINAKFDYEGAFVEPLVPLSVINDCYEAGAASVVILQVVPEDYWERVPDPGKYGHLTSGLEYIPANDFPAKFNEEDFVKIENIEGTVLLKNAEMIKKVFECDQFINIAVAKHHAGTLYTGLLKNLMGLCTRATNVHMHLGDGKKDNPERLSQCLADLHTIRKPDLHILDATRFITSNGPVGPGEVKKMEYIAAGTDPVAMDVYGAEWNDRMPEDVLVLKKSYEMGLGEMDKNKIRVQWINA